MGSMEDGTPLPPDLREKLDWVLAHAGVNDDDIAEVTDRLVAAFNPSVTLSALLANYGVSDEDIPDVVQQVTETIKPNATEASAIFENAVPDEVLDSLEEQYKGFEPGACRVCGGELTLQAIGPGTYAAWAHSKPDDGVTSYGDWRQHYRDSRVETHRIGNSSILQVVAELRARRRAPQLDREKLLESASMLTTFSNLLEGSPVTKQARVLAEWHRELAKNLESNND